MIADNRHFRHNFETNTLKNFKRNFINLFS